MRRTDLKKNKIEDRKVKLVALNLLIETGKGGVFCPSNSSQRLSVSGFLQILNVTNTAGSAFEIADELKQ